MKLLLLFLFTSQLLAQGPALPPGLGGLDSTSLSEEEDHSFFDHSGFIDFRLGTRVQKDPNQRQLSIGEIRLHNELSKDLNHLKFNSSFDLLYDSLSKNQENINLKKGTGFLDIRDFNFSSRPFDFLDIKIGRQILTWGTGDLIFINDLFPKDWRSFFNGRDLTYLKAPSDAVKTSFYTPYANLDFVYTPNFDSDRFINGSKNSYFSPTQNQKVGNKTPFPYEEEDRGEFSLRLKKNISSTELALYYYNGFWKSPMGLTQQGQFFHPRLNVYGMSTRTPLFSGIFNFEAGLYHSIQDKLGINPFIPNNEFRWLLGYEREVANNTSASFQIYQERLQDYDEYKRFNQGFNREEVRNMVTLKLRKTFWSQTLALSSMIFYAPEDLDSHLRLNADYKINDQIKFSAGSNFFWGKYHHTFWGQFSNNSNIYTGLTISF